MPPFHKEVQCQVQYYTELGVSRDQATGLRDPGDPALDGHTPLPLIESVEHVQVTWVLSAASLGICLLPEASVSRLVKWGILVPISHSCCEGPEGA